MQAALGQPFPANCEVPPALLRQPQFGKIAQTEKCVTLPQKNRSFLRVCVGYAGLQEM